MGGLLTRGLFAALTLALVSTGCGERAEQASSMAAVPQAARLEALDGSVTLLSAYADRVVVLNFWATWCAPCRQEMEGLEQLARSADARIAVLGVSVDDDVNLVREHVLRNGWTFARFIDRGRALSRGALGVDALPRTFVIAPGGSVAAVVTGARDWNSREMRGLLQAVASSTPSPAPASR